jgi:multiple sugar transport system permease protein
VTSVSAPAVAATRPRLWSPSRRRSWRRTVTAYAFIAPFLTFYVLLKLWPIVYGFWVSLHNWGTFGMNVSFVGTQNYVRVTGDSLFWQAVGNTTLFAAIATPALIGLGLALALVLNGAMRATSGFFRALFYLPNVLSVSVIGLIFVVVLRADDAGLTNNVLARMGFEPIEFLLNAATAMPSIALVAVWWTVGFNMLILLAGLQNIPEEIDDAARVDGAAGRQHFWYITLPLLRRPLMFVTILQVIFCFQLFGLIDIMTKGGPGGKTRSIVYYIFERAFVQNQLGYGSAVAFLMFALLFLLSLAQLRLFRREEDAV